MPWKIVAGSQDCPFEVVRSDTGERVACHPSEEKAMAHMRALYANEPEARATEEPYGDVKYADPGYRDGVKRYPIDTEAHARAAWSYINQADNARLYTAEQLAAIKGRIKAALKRFGVQVSEEQNRSSDVLDSPLRAPVEMRGAQLDSVNFAQRLVTMIAVPYEQPTSVPYRGEVWSEIHHCGAYDGIEKRPGRVRVNRDHDRSRTVGKAVRFWPRRDEGLVTEIRIAQTALGDETLALANEDMLDGSVGFGVRPGDQELDRVTRTRHIRTAYLDHIAFVENPAFDGAKVLSVRYSDDLFYEQPSRVAKPELDQFIAESDILRWTRARLH